MPAGGTAPLACPHGQLCPARPGLLRLRGAGICGSRRQAGTRGLPRSLAVPRLTPEGPVRAGPLSCSLLGGRADGRAGGWVMGDGWVMGGRSVGGWVDGRTDGCVQE